MPNLTEINKNLLAQQTANVERFDSLLLNYKDNLVLAYQRSIVEINQELKDLYFNLGNDISINKANEANRLNSLYNKIAKKLKALGVAETAIVSKSVRASLLDSYSYSSYSYETTFNASMKFNLLSDSVIQASLTNPLENIKWQDSIKTDIRQLNNQVRSRISEGLIRGESFVDTAKVVGNTIMDFGNADDIKGAVTKAFRIVSTESHRSQNLGADLSFNSANKSAKDLGIEDLLKEWVASLDLRTRADHGTADGDKADEEGLFHLFGAIFSSPGNSGLASQDINCRCSFITEVPGIENKKRFDNVDKKPINKITYCEWYKKKYNKSAAGCSAPTTPLVKGSKGKTTGVSTHIKTKKSVVPSNSLQRSSIINRLSIQQFSKNYRKQITVKEYNISDKVFNSLDNIPNVLTENEVRTILSYTDKGAGVINKKLTKGLSLDSTDIAYMKNLNHSISKLPNFDGTTIRSLRLEKVDLSKYKVGNTISYEAFNSTSVVGLQSTYTDNQFVNFYMKGKTGRLIQDVSKYFDESEVLYPSGSKFTVEKVIKESSGLVKVYLNEVI